MLLARIEAGNDTISFRAVLDHRLVVNVLYRSIVITMRRRVQCDVVRVTGKAMLIQERMIQDDGLKRGR